MAGGPVWNQPLLFLQAMAESSDLSVTTCHRWKWIHRGRERHDVFGRRPTKLYGSPGDFAVVGWLWILWSDPERFASFELPVIVYIRFFLLYGIATCYLIWFVFYFDWLLKFQGGETNIVVLHATLYDGCLERACLNLAFPSVSHSEKQAHFNCGLNQLKMKLMEMWKQKDGVMADKLPRYQPEPSVEEMPPDLQEPAFKLCTVIDGVLCLPRDFWTIMKFLIFF